MDRLIQLVTPINGHRRTAAAGAGEDWQRLEQTL